MKIVCVYQSGGDFTADYVAALSNQLKEHVHRPYEFVCLTDKPDEVKYYAIPIFLPAHYPSWWCKINLFDPSIFRDDTIVYFDLDVLILSDIKYFLDACQSANSPLMLRSSHPTGIENDWPSSSIMSWKGKSMHRVWYEFQRQQPSLVIRNQLFATSVAGQRTDQGFIRRYVNPPVKFQDILPKNYITFKNEYFHNPNSIKDTVILNWTGRPRFAAMNTSLEVWEYSGRLWTTHVYKKRQKNYKTAVSVIPRHLRK